MSWKQIGLRTEAQSRFTTVRVAATAAESERLSEQTRLSAYDWNGKLLWRLDEKREGKLRLTSNVVFNAGDVNGDGRTEVLITRDFEILILDGSSDTRLWIKAKPI